MGYWLDAGESFDSFAPRTFAEIVYIVDAYLEREVRHRKITTGDMFWMVSNIAAAFHAPEKLPKSLSAAFPSIHDQEVIDESQQQQRFLEGVQKYNESRRS